MVLTPLNICVGIVGQHKSAIRRSCGARSALAFRGKLEAGIDRCAQNAMQGNAGLFFVFSETVARTNPKRRPTHVPRYRFFFSSFSSL